MAYIDPEGMFGGDRMAMLSDPARFAWPWLWCAHNTMGRVELNYRVFCETVFRQFKKKPTEQQFWDWVSEFHECYLMFVYEAEDGKVWGQWDCSERYLPTYKTKADKKTPAPNAGDFLTWQKRYSDNKKKLVSGKCRVLSISKKFSEVSEFPENSSVCVGEGRKGKIIKNMSADADGSDFESVLTTVTERIHERHPEHRNCGMSIIRKKLVAIVKPLPAAERIAKLWQIDGNHEKWCAYWARDPGSKYAKGLANWLAPTEGRFDDEPPLGLFQGIEEPQIPRRML